MKTSIRFFENIPARAVWDQENNKWLFSAVDIVKAVTKSRNPRVYWNSIKRRKSELSTICRQLKLKSFEGKSYLTDVLDSGAVSMVLEIIKSKSNYAFSGWFKKSIQMSIEELGS